MRTAWRFWTQELNPHQPTRNRVQPADIENTQAAVNLWRAFLETENAHDNQGDFHTFLALAVAANRKDEPAAYFWACWRRREFGGITQTDEDDAQRELKRARGWLVKAGMCEHVASISWRVLGTLRDGQKRARPAEDREQVLQQRRVTAWQRVKERRRKRA